jgi:hypothetical protein
MTQRMSSFVLTAAVRRRGVFFAVLLVFAVVLPVFGQGVSAGGERSADPVEDGGTVTGPLGIRDLDGEADKIAGLAGRRLTALNDGAAPVVRVGGFELQGYETLLGNIWRLNLTGSISNLPDRGFILIPENAESRIYYEITGEIADAVNSVRIYTYLIDTGTSNILETWYTDLEKTEFLEELGRLSEQASARVIRDRYEPDSRENLVSAETDGTWISRTLHSGDNDWFLIVPDRNGLLFAETLGDTDTHITLYDGDAGRSLGENDDFGENTNARIEFSAEAGKRYIVMVRGYSGETTGQYRFRSGYFERPDQSLEPNDSREQAVPITIGEPVEAYFSSSSDEDWYRIEIPAGGGLFTVYTEGGNDTVLTIYDKDGNELAEDDDSGGHNNASITRSLPEGTVFIRVRLYEGDSSSGSYTLQTAVNDAPYTDDLETDGKTLGMAELSVDTPNQNWR